MSGLIERIEAAGGPDRELDCRIWCALNNADPESFFQICQSVVSDFGQWQASFYTASIDAAMTLIPDGLVVNMGNDISFCWAHVWHDLPAYNGNPFEGRAATLPLALCAAALKAREAANA